MRYEYGYIRCECGYMRYEYGYMRLHEVTEAPAQLGLGLGADKLRVEAPCLRQL